MERSTRQRRAILHALAQSGRPLRPIEILKLGQKEVPGLGLTTVYRNIRQMTADGSLVRVYYPGQPALFELPTGKFLPHFICRSCQQVYYFEEEAPDVPYNPPANFRIESQEVVFYGHCSDCP
ncbi:MAG: transcriptional repressor [Opitutae bacterium]